MLFISQKPFLRLVFVFALAVVISMGSVTGFIRLPRSLYYGALFSFGVLFFTSRGTRVGMPHMLWLLLFCFLSILYNNPPSFFRAWQRFFAFALVVIIVSPLFENKTLFELRRQLFGSLMCISIVLSVVSFFCFFGGINFFTVSDEVLAIDSGSFSGVFSHSMLLGPIAGISSIYSFTRFLEKSKRSFLFFIITICCFGSVLFSASRSALAGSVIGLAIAFFRFYRGRVTRGLIIGVFILCFLALSFPLWENWVDFMATKQQNNLDSGSIFASRRVLWQARLSEIRHYPFTGIGFCCVDTNLTPVNMETGTIEPGSSWLAVFSMTGILGFIVFLLIFCRSSRQSFLISNRIESSILSGCLAFYGVHMLFEGYVLSIGSFLGLLYWLLIGCIVAPASHSSITYTNVELDQ